MALLLHTYSLMAAMNSHVNRVWAVGCCGHVCVCALKNVSPSGEGAQTHAYHPHTHKLHCLLLLVQLLLLGCTQKMVASRLHRKCILIVKICTGISSKIVACLLTTWLLFLLPLLLAVVASCWLSWLKTMAWLGAVLKILPYWST